MAKCWGGDQRDLPVMTESAVSWGVRREMLRCFQKCLVELQMGSSTTRPALAGGWKLKSKRSNSYYLCIIIFSCCFKYSLGSLVRKKKSQKFFQYLLSRVGSLPITGDPENNWDDSPVLHWRLSYEIVSARCPVAEWHCQISRLHWQWQKGRLALFLQWRYFWVTVCQGQLKGRLTKVCFSVCEFDDLS